jgi:hypothetical protein
MLWNGKRINKLEALNRLRELSYEKGETVYFEINDEFPSIIRVRSNRSFAVNIWITRLTFKTKSYLIKQFSTIFNDISLRSDKKYLYKGVNAVVRSHPDDDGEWEGK